MLLLSLISAAPNLDVDVKYMFDVRLLTEKLRLDKVIEYEAEVTRFVDHLGLRESNNDWKITNSIDCLGEWQFSYKTLKHLGYADITPDKFKTDPSIFPRELQLKVLRELMKSNEVEINKYSQYFGSIINNAIITKAGLLAGSHLGGFGSIQIFLISNGDIDKQDCNGTKISDYIKEFGLYNL